LARKLIKQDRADQKLKEQEAEAGSAVFLILFLGMLNAITWCLPLFMWGWHHKSFVTVGAKIFTVNTGITRFNISVRCGKNKLEDVICHLLNKTSGSHSLREVMDYACLTQTSVARTFAFPVGYMLCYMMSMEFYASFIPMVAYPLTAIIYLLAVFLLFYYWEVSNLKAHRTWAMTLFTVAPVVGTAGFIAWTVVAPDLTELPLALTGGPGSPIGVLFASLGTAAGSGLGTEVNEVDFGMAWFFSIVCIFWSLVTLIMLFTFLRPREDEIEGKSEDEEEVAEEDYSGGPPGQGQAPGA